MMARRQGIRGSGPFHLSPVGLFCLRLCRLLESAPYSEMRYCSHGVTSRMKKIVEIHVKHGLFIVYAEKTGGDVKYA